MSDTEPEKLYTFTEAAEKLGVPERRLQFFATRGVIESNADTISESALLKFQARSSKNKPLAAGSFNSASAREKLVRNAVLEMSGVDSETATRLGYPPL